jgi:radical SAM superfamily enzyme YgiQ (UPF0313 family)
MVDILLIQPCIRDFYFTKKRSIPYGLMCLSSALQQSKFSVEILDCLATNKSRVVPMPQEIQSVYNDFYTNEDTLPWALFHTYKEYGLHEREIRNRIQNSGAKIVGIASLFTPYCQESYRMASLVREILPDAVIIFGGHHATALPQHVLENSCADFCLRGEAEESFPLLVQRIFKNQSVDDVPGIAYRQADHSYYIQPATYISDYSYPILPDFANMDHVFYQRYKKNCAVITTSRGCPLSCSYCCVNRHTVPFRQRTVESVIKELNFVVQNYHAHFIDFEDENISFHKNWFHQLLHQIMGKYGDSLELRAMNGLYPPTLDEQTILLMKKAGFRELNLALVTTSALQLQYFQRANVQFYLERAIQYAHSIGMSTVSYIIVGAPHQNPYESLEDLIYLAKLPTIIGTSVYYPAPNSKDYEYCKEQNLLPKDISSYRSTAIPINHTTTKLQSVTLLRLSRITNYIKSLQPDNIIRIMDWKEKFLIYFFQNKRIPGMNKQGILYDHAVDGNLVEKYVDALISL